MSQWTQSPRSVSSSWGFSARVSSLLLTCVQKEVSCFCQSACTINCFLLNEKAINCGWATLYLQAVEFSQVTNLGKLLLKHFRLTTVISGAVKESIHAVIFFFSWSFKLWMKVIRNVFMILVVLMNMVFVLYLGIRHFIVCLPLNILSDAAYLRRSESVSFHQGWNNFSPATRAGVLIMSSGDGRPTLVSVASWCWHVAVSHIPVASPNQGYLGLSLFLAYWEPKWKSLLDHPVF